MPREMNQDRLNKVDRGRQTREADAPLAGGCPPAPQTTDPVDMVAGITLAALAIPEVMGYTSIALTQFAEAYADQSERDHAALVDAIRTGRVTAESGV